MAKKIIIIISVFAVVCGSFAFAFAPTSASAQTSYPSSIDTWNASGYLMGANYYKGSAGNITNLSTFTLDNFSSSVFGLRLNVNAYDLKHSPNGEPYYDRVSIYVSPAADNTSTRMFGLTGLNTGAFGDIYYFSVTSLPLNGIGLSFYNLSFCSWDAYFNFGDVVSCSVTYSDTFLSTVVAKAYGSNRLLNTLPTSNVVQCIRYVFSDINGYRFDVVFPWANGGADGYTDTTVYFKDLDDNQMFQNGFNQGYQQGYVSGDSEGYNTGYSAGKNEGYDIGYTTGYNEGLTAENDYTFLNLFTSVVQAPVDIFKSMFDFEILGFNLSHFLTALLSVGLIIAIVARIKS